MPQDVKASEIQKIGTPLVVQWIRIHLLMQGTQVQSLVWEDFTCLRAMKLLHHNEPAHEPELLNPRLEPVLCNKNCHCNKMAGHCNEE